MCANVSSAIANFAFSLFHAKKKKIVKRSESNRCACCGGGLGTSEGAQQQRGILGDHERSGGEKQHQTHVAEHRGGNRHRGQQQSCWQTGELLAVSQRQTTTRLVALLFCSSLCRARVRPLRKYIIHISRQLAYTHVFTLHKGRA